ncbi:MAG: hypothetical protein ABSE64_12600 [Vulcanimicrobiaceae bacterium]
MLGLLVALLVLVVPVQGSPAHHSNVQHPVAPHPGRPPSRATMSAYAGDLFSRRARRRAAVILRLRWEDLRLAQLDRIRAAIRRQIPIDDLLREK